MPKDKRTHINRNGKRWNLKGGMADICMWVDPTRIFLERDNEWNEMWKPGSTNMETESGKSICGNGKRKTENHFGSADLKNV
jgi:hypothetical protein